MSSKRDGTGRFRSEDGTKPSPDRNARPSFDLQAEAQRLYATAQAKGDFTGAASVLRLMRDLRPAPGETAPIDRWVEWTTADELATLEAAFASIDAVERVAKARRDLGGDPPQVYTNGDATSWRDSPETLEERKARGTSAKDAPSIADLAPEAEAPWVLEDDEIEILLDEGEVLPGEES